MFVSPSVLPALSHIPGLAIALDEPLSRHTRFALGGPADVYAVADTLAAVAAALTVLRTVPHTIVGEGSNVIAADEGYRGVVLRFAHRELSADGAAVRAAAGTPLQELVDFTIAHGLAGLHTMTGIPGSVGAAVYGNAGAYGNAIAGHLTEAEFFEAGRVRALDRAACEFHYRGSIFKRHKEWVILSARFTLQRGDPSALAAEAARILAVRNRKYPPELRCAGSIFKNLLYRELPAPVRADLPAGVVIEGKVPAAYFLEAVGAKGMSAGGIHVATYHANLIFNDGTGTAAAVRALIAELQQRVAARFDLNIEEEVQYLGF